MEGSSVINEEYLNSEIEKIRNLEESELLTDILEYEGPLPLCFDTIFNVHHNSMGMPEYACYEVMKKHEENLVLHGRHEYFKKEGETFLECDKRLMNNFMEKTNIYIKNE